MALQVGDHDPAGEEIFGALAADVTAFLADDAPEAKVQFIRAAVTPDQIAMYGLRPHMRRVDGSALGPLRELLLHRQEDP